MHKARNQHKPLVVNITDAARMMAVSRNAIYNMLEDGRLTAVHIGERSPRIRIADIEALLDGGAS